MPLPLQGQTGPGTYGDGSAATLRLGKSGELIVQELHGRYYEQTYRGNVFVASNAASTSSAGLAATYTGGVCLSNPAGSTKNLVVLKVSAALVVISAAVTTAGVIIGYASGGITAHTTPLTPSSTLLGSQASAVGKVDQATTLVGTPAWFNVGLGATPATIGAYAGTVDFEGKLIITPGGYVATGTSIASPAAGVLATISWEEVPV